MERQAKTYDEVLSRMGVLQGSGNKEEAELLLMDYMLLTAEKLNRDYEREVMNIIDALREV